MPDRKRTIHGLESCSTRGNCRERGCPYFEDENCTTSLSADALALLREQETTWIREEDRVNHWRCEKCGFVEGITSRFHKYCPNCGRKVKWE